MIRVLAAVVALGVFAAACGGEEVPDGPSVEGIVVDVAGDLEAVTGFTLVDASGETFTFVAEEGLTFHGGPLSHLSAHVTSGEPVLVVYQERSAGLVAVFVSDA